jgi:hypothetical protein
VTLALAYYGGGNDGMNPAARRLVRALGVGLDAHGVCPACLSMIAMELDGSDPVSLGRVSRFVTATLWLEGLGGPVEDALYRARRRSVPGVEEAWADFEARGPRSDVFRGVVRHLAEELKQDMDRTIRAMLN